MDVLKQVDRIGIASITTAISILVIPLWWWYQHQNVSSVQGSYAALF